MKIELISVIVAYLIIGCSGESRKNFRSESEVPKESKSFSGVEASCSTISGSCDDCCRAFDKSILNEPVFLTLNQLYNDDPDFDKGPPAGLGNNPPGLYRFPVQGSAGDQRTRGSNYPPPRVPRDTVFKKMPLYRIPEFVSTKVTMPAIEDQDGIWLRAEVSVQDLTSSNHNNCGQSLNTLNVAQRTALGATGATVYLPMLSASIQYYTQALPGETRSIITLRSVNSRASYKYVADSGPGPFVIPSIRYSLDNFRFSDEDLDKLFVDKKAQKSLRQWIHGLSEKDKMRNFLAKIPISEGGKKAVITQMRWWPASVGNPPNLFSPNGYHFLCLDQAIQIMCTQKKDVPIINPSVLPSPSLSQ